MAAEVLNAIEVVQSYGAENREAHRYADANRVSLHTAVRRMRTRAFRSRSSCQRTMRRAAYRLPSGTSAPFLDRKRVV